MGYSLKSLMTKNAVRGSCVVIYSEPGLGKTTLAADMAKDTNGVFILGEDGLSALGYEDIARTPVVSEWQEFQAYIEELAMSDHDFKTVIIDTIDAIMPSLHEYVVDKFYGGDVSKANAFKAYYTEQLIEFNNVLKAFKVIQDKGINVLVLCHSVIADHRSPDSETYKKYELNLPGGTKTDLGTALVSYADMVLFGKKDVVVSDKQAKGGTRVLMTGCSAAFDAKSRKTVPDKIAMTWDMLKKYL